MSISAHTQSDRANWSKKIQHAVHIQDALSVKWVFCNLQDAAKHQKNKNGSTPLTTKTTATVTPHYKLNMRPTAKFHPISLSSPSRHQDKQRLFEGLEDSMGGAGGETFVPRHKSIKKLNIKPKPTQVLLIARC